MTPQLSIHLLGEFRLLIDNQLVTKFSQRRLQALLAYLLLHRHAPQSRQHVAYQLWPDSSERQALTNLRKLFFMLRDALPAADSFLYADSQTVGWRPDAACTLDVAELEVALNELEHSDVIPVAPLKRVLALYAAELLPASYEEWLLPMRRAVHERVIITLTHAIGGLETQGEFEIALGAAEHLLRLEPTHEAAYRHLMRLRMLRGDRAGALRAYHACVTMLEQELDVSPTSVTQALYQRLLKFEPNATPTLSVPAQPRHEHVPLVGRKQEWQALQKAWRQMGSRRPHLITIWGEAGMGKTRLVDELVHWARLRPGTAVFARAYAAEGALAYAPLTEWLRSEPLVPILVQQDHLWQTELARLLPELLTAHPELPAPAPMNESWQRQRFHEALARVVLAAPSPRLLVLDDLQWCDAETLEWLRYLLRFDAQAPLLVVGTIRSEAIDNQHSLHDLLLNLRREEQLTSLELGPLLPDETASLARQLVRDATDAWVNDLHRESEGNPLYVVETVRARGTGQAGSPGSTTSLPPTVQAVIAAHLAQLSPLAQQVAQIAATVGRHFTFAILATVEEMREEDLIQSLDELWQRRIVREQEHGYDFRHDKIREVVYSQISRTRRQWLHRRIAAALEALHAPHLEEVYGVLAAHLQRAGEAQRAIHYWLQAGEHALATYAPRQALDNFQRALALTDEVRTAISKQADVHFGIARAHFTLDQLDEAALHSQHALELLPSDEPRQAKVLYFMAEVAFAQYDVTSCERHAQAARAAAEAGDDQETYCQSLSLLGQVYSTQGEVERELQLITEALQRCRQTGNRWREGRTLADLGWIHAQRAEFADAIAAADTALAILSTTDDRAGVAFVWNVLGRGYGGCGQYTAAFAAFAQSEAVAASIDHKFLLAQVPNMRGWLYFQLGDYARALEVDEQGVQIAHAWQKRPAEISALINVALDMLYLDEPEAALVRLQDLQHRIEQEAFGFHAWRWRLRLWEGQGLCYLALHQPGRAFELAVGGEELARATASRKYLAANQMLMGEALVHMGQAEDALQWLEQAVALADTIGYQPLRWRGYLHLAELYSATGREQQAQACHSQVLQIIQGIATEIDDDGQRTQFLARSGRLTRVQPLKHL